MPTSFPTSLDNFTNPASTDNLNTAGVLHDEQHANINDAVEALEARVGITSSAVATSHDKRIADLEGAGAATLVEGDAVDITESGGNVTISSLPLVVRFNVSSGAAIAASATEWPNSQRRTKLDLTYAKQVRIVVRTSSPAGQSGATMAFQYSTDDTTFSAMDGSSGPSVTVDVTNSTRVSSWVNLASGAKADVYIRMAGSGGDGSTSITLGTIELQVR